MRKLYAITMLAFLFAGAVAIAENPVAIDGVGEMPAIAEQPEVVVCENDLTVLKNKEERETPRGTVTIDKIELDPGLSITAFGNYSVQVDVTKDAGVTIDKVTLTATPLSYFNNQLVEPFNWNYYTWGDPSDNDPVERTIVGDAESYSFTGAPGPSGSIRPDDIYPEIHFATDFITHNNDPINAPIKSNNIQLMKFNNPFQMGDDTSFFIEFYAEPNNPNPPPPVSLDVYLVGQGTNGQGVVSSIFEAEDWIDATGAVLVGTIGRDDDFDHTHSEFSKHHLVRLSADADGKVAGLDVYPDFWVVLTAPTTDDRRSWNLKYHLTGDIEDGTNNGTWFKRVGTDEVEAQIGFPDVHVHLARNQGQEILVDGLRLDVEVTYNANNTVTATRSEFFGAIGNLPPNASSFIKPDPGEYIDEVLIEWNPASDPNNDFVTYNIYLYDVITQKDVYTIKENHNEPFFSFNTTSGDPSPKDGVYNIRIEACDPDNECSSSFFLYDIYDIGDEFVIANNPITWSGSEDNNWNTIGNWSPATVPDANKIALIPTSVTNDLVIGDEINAQARRLSIAAGRTVTIESDGKLEVTQSLVNEALDPDNLVVEPGASLIHNTPWPSEGVPATVKNYILGGGTSWKKNATAWYYIAAPVVDQNIEAAMNDAFDGTPGVGDFDLYRWSEADDEWINYHGNDFGRDEFLSGEGYIFGAPDQVTLSLSGKLASGDAIWENLTYSGTGSIGLNPEDVGYYTPGWHLLGNPFPSGIVRNANWWYENIVHTPKLWNGSTYDDVSDGELIPANTAFFMQVENITFDGDNTLTIPSSARAHEAPPPKNIPQNRILLLAQAEGSEMRQQHVIRLEPDAAEGFDPRYDSRFMAGYAPQLFSITETDRLSTITISEINDSLVIPMVFRKNHEDGIFLIHLKRNIDDTNLYLRDLKTGTWHELGYDKPYTFTASPDDDPIRFELHFSPPEDDDDVSIQEKPDQATAQLWYHNNRLYVQTDETGTHLTIYDLNGRTLQTYRPEPGLQSYHINLPPGAYIARLNGNKTHETLKIITTNTP